MILIHMFQLSTYNVKPVSSDSTLDASFSPEGMFVISGNTQFSLRLLVAVMYVASAN